MRGASRWQHWVVTLLIRHAEYQTVTVTVIVWLTIYLTRAVTGHYSLQTNAFDLSVFDYALWGFLDGRPGFVPFFGHSIFSQHFMPILGLVTPYYAVFQSPVCLIVLQPLVVAVSALMLFSFARRIELDRLSALALVVVYLFSRRVHSAVSGYFYPEVFQVALTFALVQTWSRGTWTFWLSSALFLMTKEDAPLYLASGALVSLVTPYRNPRRTVGAVVLALVWLVLALLVAIPASRSFDGLGPGNPIAEARFGGDRGMPETAVLAGRLMTGDTAQHVTALLLTTGGLSLLGAVWLAPAIPGIVANLVAEPGSLQSSILDHYAWPILPWLFMAAAAGLAVLSRRARRLSTGLAWIVACATLANNPALQRLGQMGINPKAREVRLQLAQLRGSVVLAQPNLIPHLGHGASVFAVGGGYVQPSAPADLVLLTEVGNLWPLTESEVEALEEHYGSDPAYEHIIAGPLHAFRLRPPVSAR